MKNIILNDQIMQLKIKLKMEKSTIQQKRPTQTMKTFINYFHKTRIEIVGDLMVYGIEERGIKKRNQFNI